MSALYLGHLVRDDHKVRENWRRSVVRVTREAAQELGSSFSAMGVPYVIDRSEREVFAKLDDMRGRCSVCFVGEGKHRCANCQQELLLGQLVLSVSGVRR